MGILKRSRAARTKIFFATDIHGSDRCFRKFLNAAKHYQADHIIIGGDLTGKVLVPIERRASGYAADYGDKHYVDMGEDECRELKKLIRDRGSYYVVGTHDELLELADPEASERAFRRAARESIVEWVGLAEERLHGTGIRCFITPGNDDYPEVDEVLMGSSVVEYVEGQAIVLNDTYQMLTTGYANETPWHSPRELPEAELSQRIEELFAKADPGLRTLAVLHVPPHNSTLDQAPAVEVVNGEIRIKMSSGSPLMAGAG